MAALQINASIFGTVLITSCAAFFTEACTDKSIFMDITFILLPNSFFKVAMVFSTFLGFLLSMITLAPLDNNIFAASNPVPLVVPVITYTLLLKSPILFGVQPFFPN